MEFFHLLVLKVQEKFLNQIVSKLATEQHFKVLLNLLKENFFYGNHLKYSGITNSPQENLHHAERVFVEA